MFSFIKRIFSYGKSSLFEPLAPGAYYAIRYDEACYKVLKVLAIDEAKGKPYGVHICLYGHRFSQPPTQVGTKEELEGTAQVPPTQPLTIGAVLAALEPAEMTIGHLPYTYEAFLRMKPQFIQAGKVENFELEGYRIWAEDRGGYWN